jgi:hypothetical protein
MIQYASDTGKSLITICNYSKYQLPIHDADTLPDTLPIHNRYAADTNYKEGKKEIKEDSPSGESVAADPKTKLEQSNVGRAKPRRRITPDWQPSAEDRKFAAVECGLDPDEAAAEFRDYWIGRGDPMADWSATFRNSCRKAPSRGRVAGGRSGANGSRPGGIAAALRDVLGHPTGH